VFDAQAWHMLEQVNPIPVLPCLGTPSRSGGQHGSGAHEKAV